MGVESIQNYPSYPDLIAFQQSLHEQVVNINATYLGITVTIVFAVAGILMALIYFANFRPLFKHLKKQQASVKELRNAAQTDKEKNEEQMKSLIKKIEDTENESENKLIRLQGEVNKAKEELLNQLHNLAVQQAWSEHYTWEAKNLHMNALRTLNYCLTLCLAYKNEFMEKMAMDAIERVFILRPLSELKAESQLLEDIEKNIIRLLTEESKKVAIRVGEHIKRVKETPL